MILGELFVQIGVVIVVAAVLSFLINRLRQPLIIAYILTGVLIGPSLLGLSSQADFFSTLSDVGVAFLLFTVGLNLDWKHIKEVGWTALGVGLGQVVFTSAIGYFLARALHFDLATSLYLGLAFTFSSTIIIGKLLSDKDDLDRLYGRISVGLLIVQDLIAMFILLFLGTVGSGQSFESIAALVLGKWLLTIVGVFLLSTFVLPRLTAYAARSQELLFLFGLAWCFGLAGLLSVLGFGIEFGALLAGLSLAGTGWSKELAARFRPLRDFFLIIFFVFLGAQLTLPSLEALAVPVAVFSVFILIGNPFIVLVLLRTLGYHPRVGFMAGTTVAQVSEFSFILLAAGIKLGQIEPSILTLATLVGLITITVSSYLITFNDVIYDFFSPLFRWFEPKGKASLGKRRGIKTPEVVLFGWHRMGEVVLPKVRALGKPYVVVDFDPAAATELTARHVPFIYGDAGDHDFLSDLKLEKAKLVISTIPDEDVSLQIVHYLKHKKFTGVTIVTAKTSEHAAHLYRDGAHFVIIPSVLGGERFAEMLKKNQLNQKTWVKTGRR
ncbi:MAG: cation:proton antiporter family protein [Patescibacteria group bacterium]